MRQGLEQLLPHRLGLFGVVQFHRQTVNSIPKIVERLCVLDGSQDKRCVVLVVTGVNDTPHFKIIRQKNRFAPLLLSLADSVKTPR